MVWLWLGWMIFAKKTSIGTDWEEKQRKNDIQIDPVSKYNLFQKNYFGGSKFSSRLCVDAAAFWEISTHWIHGKKHLGHKMRGYQVDNKCKVHFSHSNNLRDWGGCCCYWYEIWHALAIKCVDVQISRFYDRIVTKKSKQCLMNTQCSMLAVSVSILLHTLFLIWYWQKLGRKQIKSNDNEKQNTQIV